MNSSLALSVLTVLYGHHLCLVPTHLSPQSEPHTPGHHSPLPPPATPLSFPSLWVCRFWVVHVNGIRRHMSTGSGFSHSAWCLQGSSALWHLSGRQPFPQLGSVPCTAATFPLSPPLSLRALGTVPTSRLVQSRCCEHACASACLVNEERCDLRRLQERLLYVSPTEDMPRAESRSLRPMSACRRGSGGLL